MNDEQVSISCSLKRTFIQVIKSLLIKTPVHIERQRDTPKQMANAYNIPQWNLYYRNKVLKNKISEM